MSISNSNRMTGKFQSIISSYLPLLHSYPIGTMLYVLDCLCPENFPIHDFVYLDLSLPHRHPQRSLMEVRPKPALYQYPLIQSQLKTNLISSKDYPQFWLELAQSCLLTCPVDPIYYREDQNGKELFCQILRSELIERILRID